LSGAVPRAGARLKVRERPIPINALNIAHQDIEKRSFGWLTVVAVAF
jgi:hypothetical protein